MNVRLEPSRQMPRRTPRISPSLWRGFGWYAERALRKSFHAVRLDRGGGTLDAPVGLPLIVYSNHPSWWDPMVAIFLARRFFPRRRHYWPIDADMLRKYPFFAKLGFFGIERDDPRGGAAFLRTARDVLRSDDACLWVTAEGEFADPRRRPLRLRPGLAHVARRLDRGVILPLCCEYAFWTERAPEILLRVGQPIAVAGPESSCDAWHELLGSRLEENLDALATSSSSRQPMAFTTLLAGKSGVAHLYDAWRRIRAAAAGRPFDAAHVPEPTSPPAEVQRP